MAMEIHPLYLDDVDCIQQAQPDDNDDPPPSRAHILMQYKMEIARCIQHIHVLQQCYAAVAASETPSPLVQHDEEQSRLSCASDVTDAQWERIEPLLPPLVTHGRPRADRRRTLNGILYVLRTPCAWNLMPRRYGSATTCWRRLLHWQQQGTWQRIQDILAP